MAAIRAQNAEADRAAGLVYTLDVEPGHAIKFYAPREDGVAYMMEEGAAEQNPAMPATADHTAAAIFKALRPGEAVPDALVRLDESMSHNLSADTLEPETPGLHAGASGPAEGNAGTVEKHVSSDGADFGDHHRMCPTQFTTCTALDTDYSACLLNVSGGWWTYDTVDHSQIYIMAYNGNVIFTPTLGKKAQSTTTILSGNWIRYAAWSGSSSQILMRFDMTGGAGFHFGSLFANSARCKEIDVSRYTWP